MIRALTQAEKEIARFPLGVREELADLLARLDQGHLLSMPVSRPLPSVGRNVHELRVRDRSGNYRVVYVVLGRNEVVLLHAFQKKSAKLPQTSAELSRKRLKELK